jgi:hypothetical protein
VVRYYLDFCHKYEFNALNDRSLPAFIDKLRSKEQTEVQQQQAANAIHLFYAMETPTRQKNNSLVAPHSILPDIKAKKPNSISGTIKTARKTRGAYLHSQEPTPRPQRSNKSILA